MNRAINWNGELLELLDQTQLPEKSVVHPVRTIEEAFEAIRNLRVRGAPAIGITAAYGLYLGMRTFEGGSRERFLEELERKIDYLAGARPTAVNLYWALQALKGRLEGSEERDPDRLKASLLELAKELHEDDAMRCRRMAAHGQALVPEKAGILTHCNTGALATGGIGTAFGVIYHAHEAGKGIEVFADETRPVLQGARLTMWELAANGVPARLICDGAAASLMQMGKIDLVIVGADRIAADGSVANKIGTYQVAIAARYHGIPFYVAAPLSTFDRSLASGESIPIEERNEEEVRRVLGETLITLPEARCCNPAFDVTPAELVTAIVTEQGVIYPPFKEGIEAAFASGSSESESASGEAVAAEAEEAKVSSG